MSKNLLILAKEDGILVNNLLPFMLHKSVRSIAHDWDQSARREESRFLALFDKERFCSISFPKQTFRNSALRYI